MLHGDFQRAFQCPRCLPDGPVNIDSFHCKYFLLSSFSVMVVSIMSRSVTLGQLSRSNWVMVSKSSFWWSPGWVQQSLLRYSTSILSKLVGHWKEWNLIVLVQNVFDCAVSVKLNLFLANHSAPVSWVLLIFQINIVWVMGIYGRLWGRNLEAGDIMCLLSAEP